jgi:hypothetical protein
VAPGELLTLEVWVDDTGGLLLGGYQAAFAGTATPIVGTGSIAYVDNPGIGDSMIIDEANPDWVFFGQIGVTVFLSETGLPLGFAGIALLPFGSGVAVPGLAYAGEFQLQVSPDASGLFSYDILPGGAPPNGGTALTDQTGAGQIPSSLQPLLIEIPPANDECDDAVTIPAGDTAFQTATATTSVPNANFGGAGNGLCDDNGDDTIENDIWYEHTAACPGVITVSTCDQADFDTRIEIFSGCGVCPTSSLVGCNDNGVACGAGTSEAQFSATAGTCYTLRVGGLNDTESGLGTLSIVSDSCFIDGACRAPGEANPSNECEVCDPSISTVAWSSVTSGTACTDDGNGCTDNVCNGAGACVANNNSAPCDDSLFCNGSDTCSGGSCSLHTGDPCSGGAECANVCDEAADSCNASAGTACTDDGLDCTQDICDTMGTCTHPPTPVGTACTDDGNACTDNVCDGFGACSAVNNTAACDDGVFCNGPDVCSFGSCSIHSGNPCFGGPECSNLCDEGGATCNLPVGTACTDDGNGCTDNTCDGAGACVTTNNSAPCDDGVFCNGPDNCSGGACTVNSGNPCELSEICDEVLDECSQCNVDADCMDEGNPCTDHACLDGTCVTINNNAVCDDGLFCNGSDTCSGGNCSIHAGDPCIGGAECDDLCDESADSCNVPSGTPCAADAEECTLDECDGAGACAHPPVTSGVPCTDDGDICTNDECDGAGACGHPPAAIGTVCPDDGNICTLDECDGAGSCAHPPGPGGVPCPDDGNDCTMDECDSGGVCVHPPESAGTACDDGLACTGTGEPGVGIDECDGAGDCSGMLDPSCANLCVDAGVAVEGVNLANNTGFGTELQVSCAFSSTGDTWFVHTANCDGVLHFATTGSDFDTVLTVYDECGGPELDCDDDGGPGLASALSLPVVAGEDYFVRIAGFGSAAGDVVLTLRRLDTCRIDSVCYDEGTVNPGNDCDVCEPLLTADDWSPAVKGTACGSGTPDDPQCDASDSCDGAGVCESNHKPQGLPCGDQTDTECDNPDSCDGNGFCGVNFERPGFACGDPTDTDCDNPDTCDGGGGCLDNLESVGFACGSPGDTECDNPDTCDGSGGCLDNFESSGFTCGDQTDTECDNADSCDGSGGCLDNFELPGFTCGDPTDTECDNSDTCNGAGSCLDNFESSGFACGNQIDSECDNPDTCDGSGGCLDNFESSGFTCGDGSDTECDNPDTCDGGGGCVDNFESPGFLCGNPADSQCDNPDTCDGSGGCLDNLENSGFACGDPTDNDCDNPDSCDGIGACQANFENFGFGCGDPTATECDSADTCNGGGICLVNFALPGVGCGDVADTECDDPDSCDGFGDCQPNFVQGGAACGDPTDTGCDNPDSCDGTGGCSINLEPVGFSCGDSSDTDCDNPDTCDGSGGCLDNFEAGGLACGDTSDTQCDNPDTCDGSGGCLDNFEAGGFACGDANDTECDNPDSCDGLGLCQFNFESSGVICGDPNNTSCDNPDSCDGVGTCAGNAEVDGTPCPNGVFCDGDETCQTAVCTDGADPCIDAAHCDEGGDVCYECLSTNECADTDMDGVIDDGCMWYACVDNTCESTPREFGDVGGPFGDCPIDGFANVHDKNHVLTCFELTNTCDHINIDVGGPFGDCDPDGFCNVHDMNHVLAAFDLTTTCACPTPPAPEFDPPAVGVAQLKVVGPRAVRPSETFEVRVFLDGPVEDLRSYQLHIAGNGGTAGQLDLVEITTEVRKDFVFGDAQRFEGYSPWRQQVMQGLEVGTVNAQDQGYLATFFFKASPDATGVFTVDLLTDLSQGHQTFIIGANDGRIDVTATTSAVIVVGQTPKRTAGR